uniref:Uncharacterized protein n=1 Tax=Arundo donax TaxID=35708 RepID=A0A0A9DX10_ARUDO
MQCMAASIQFFLETKKKKSTKQKEKTLILTSPISLPILFYRF